MMALASTPRALPLSDLLEGLARVETGAEKNRK
jgi:hypothetical protein